MTYGKRGCCMSLALGLQVLGLTFLLAGVLTPFWSRVVGEKSNLKNIGILLSLDQDDNVVFLNFNTLMKGEDETTDLYQVLCLSFALLDVFVQFFLVQAYAFALYNKSCGKKYNPEIHMTFSMLSGMMGIACLVLYEQWNGRNMSDATDIDTLYEFDYSRGLVILFIACTFVASFFTVCDRRQTKGKN